MRGPVYLPAEVRALILATVAGRVETERELVKATFSGTYMAGSKQTFRSPLDDAPLGYVQRTDPAPEWRVTDPDALTGHLAAEFPGVVETVYEVHTPGGSLTLTDVDELYVVLAEHAPHMLHPLHRIDPAAVTAAVEQSKATGVAAAPGIGRVRPGGQMRIVPDKAAAEAVVRMVAAGLVDWGQLALGAGDKADGVAS